MPNASSSSSIDGFVSEIRSELYGPWWTRRRIAEEFRTHLEDSVERLREDGVTREDAEVRAIERFGSAADVARSLARARGVGVSNETTRWGGLTLAVGAVALGAVTIGQDFSESFRNGLHGEAVVAARVLCALGLVAMYRRVRGNLGVWGRRGSQLALAGFVVGFVSSLAWFEPGGWVGLSLMALGIGVYLRAVLRTGVLPAVSVAALAASIAATFVVGFAGTAVRADTGSAAVIIGSIGIAGAACRLGLWLWSEPSPDARPTGGTLAAAGSRP